MLLEQLSQNFEIFSDLNEEEIIVFLNILLFMATICFFFDFMKELNGSCDPAFWLRLDGAYFSSSFSLISRRWIFCLEPVLGTTPESHIWPRKRARGRLLR